MSEYLSAEDLANDINMCRTGFSGTIVVIEGETDQTVFERFFDLDACLFLPANSKDNAIQAFEFLGEQEQEGVIVIVDADFDHLVKNAAHAESIFLTDFHDLEIMMIESPALEIVLRQYASPGKIQMVRKARGGASVRRILYDAVLPLGILRLVSKRMRLNLSFENINYKKIIPRDFTGDAAGTVVYILQFTKSKTRNEEAIGLDYREITVAVRSQLRDASEADRLQLCCGHDITAALALALKRLIGSVKESAARTEHIEKSLRLAYDFSSFKATILYSELVKWETANTEYRIF